MSDSEMPDDLKVLVGHCLPALLALAADGPLFDPQLFQPARPALLRDLQAVLTLLRSYGMSDDEKMITALLHDISRVQDASDKLVFSLRQGALPFPYFLFFLLAGEGAKIDSQQLRTCLSLALDRLPRTDTAAALQTAGAKGLEAILNAAESTAELAGEGLRTWQTHMEAEAARDVARIKADAERDVAKINAERDIRVAEINHGLPASSPRSPSTDGHAHAASASSGSNFGANESKEASEAFHSNPFGSPPSSGFFGFFGSSIPARPASSEAASPMDHDREPEAPAHRDEADINDAKGLLSFFFNSLCST